MSSPPITVHSDLSCKEAGQILTRYNINALVVTQNRSGNTLPVGYINRQVVEKTLFHGLGHVPVEEYMNRRLACVELEADLSEIQEKIIENKQRILPVMENGILKGVITRTDLLNTLVRQTQSTMGNLQDPHRESIQARTRNITKLHERKTSRENRERPEIHRRSGFGQRRGGLCGRGICPGSLFVPQK